jgi:predicted RNase H-related nuclease YkuK (DUF458 family)
MFKTARFYSPTMGRLTFDQVVDEIVRIMEEDPDTRYEIMVGSDSHSSPHGGARWTSSRLLLSYRVGKGGRYFWRRIREAQYLYAAPEGIYREAFPLSFELAKALMEELERRTLLDYNLEIHVDVGRNGRTRELIDEVVGMIMASGFPVKTKPESYAASCVADKHA